MGNYQGGGGGGFRGGGGGRPSFQKKSWGGDRDRETVMHKATCDECQKTCEVPFRPTGDKPVYCSDCFRGKRDEGGDRGGSKSFNDRGPRKNFDDRAPRQDYNAKPAFGGNDDVKKQLAEVNVKLDRLIKSIEGMTQTKSVVQAPAPKAEVKSTGTLKTVVKKAVASKAPAKKAVGKKKK